MAGITLSIMLDKPDKTYEGGETITGLVKVSVAEKIETAALMIVLYCKGFSKAKNINRTIEKAKEEMILFKGSWIPKEYIYPFEIVAPLGNRRTKVIFLMLPGILELKYALLKEKISRLKRKSLSFQERESLMAMNQ